MHWRGERRGGDLNPSAQRLILQSDEQVIGEAVAQVLPDLAPWLEQAGFEREFRVELSRGSEEEQRFFDLHISPLRGPGSQVFGRLVSFHEITLLKQEQARLERARAELEQVVHERTETLRMTIEQLQYELSQRSLAEKRFEKVVELAPDAMILLDSDVRILLVNKQTEELFGYPREELIGNNIRKLIPLNRRDQDHQTLKRYVDNPIAKRNLAGRVVLTQGTAAHIPLRPSSFDGVASRLVLNFVPDPRAALTEMARVTRPGGSIGAYLWDYAGKMEFMRHFCGCCRRARSGGCQAR